MRTNPRIIQPAPEIPADAWCTCCERSLSGKRVAYLELDQRTDTYHDFGDVPPEHSQGWFPFGITCAKRKLDEHAKLQAA